MIWDLNKIKESLKLKQHTKNFVTFDIGSETVKSSLMEIDVLNSKLNVVSLIQEPLSDFSYQRTFSEKLDDYSIAIDKCLSSFKKVLNRKISTAVVVLDGSKYRAVTTSLKVTRPNDSEIKVFEKNEILEKLFEGAYEEVREIIELEQYLSEPELEVVEFFPVFIEVDGKDVLDLEGESGKVIEVCYTIFFAFSDEITHIRHLFKSKKFGEVVITPSSLVTLEGIKRTKKQKVDCVILDVGASSTEAVVCFRGGVYQNKILNIGGADFTESISKKLNLTYLNAEKIKRFYTFGKLKDKENLAVQKVILEVLDSWSCGVEDLFNDFKDVKLFASDFYLVGGGSDLPDIKEQLFEEPWTKSIPFKSNPTFKKIEYDKLIDLDLGEHPISTEFLITYLASYYYFVKHRT